MHWQSLDLTLWPHKIHLKTRVIFTNKSLLRISSSCWHVTNRSVYTERRRGSFFTINFYWRRVALKCCVGFYSTNTNESAIYTCVCVCVPSLLDFLPIQATTEHWVEFLGLYSRWRSGSTWLSPAACLPWSTSTWLSFHTPPCPGTQRRCQAPTDTCAFWEPKGRKSFRWPDGARS